MSVGISGIDVTDGQAYHLETQGNMPSAYAPQ